MQVRYVLAGLHRSQRRCVEGSDGIIYLEHIEIGASSMCRNTNGDGRTGTISMVFAKTACSTEDPAVRSQRSRPLFHEQDGGHESQQ